MSETVFTKVDYDLGSLMNFIELGEIGLPDIQRPFVWSNTKVRNLFDSMYRGYPVGYFLFWQNAFGTDTRSIGTESKQKAQRLLIVDGQQRLTSLYAVINKQKVLRENYKEELIKIAFNPLTEKFEVTDAAIEKDKSFIPNISVVWDKATDIFDVLDDYLDGLKGVRELSDEESKQVRKAIQKLASLKSYPFTVLELAKDIDDEQVSEVFVRINSEGKQLNQADFILTLMSVFWDEGRKQLEDFCRLSRIPELDKPSPFNNFIQPSPDQLLRVSVGLAFKRARLKYVYSILRGKDLETEEFSDALRDEQFEKLKDAQSRVLNLQHWHDFLAVLRSAGYRDQNMITSDTNLVYTYVFYLMGRTEYQVDPHELRKVIALRFFMSSMTGRYTASPETQLEFDLGRFSEIHTAEDFCERIRQTCKEAVSSDYWTITYPGDLATAAAKSPSQSAYFAALCVLDANVLFSDQKVSDFLSLPATSPRKPVERHHLFPKAHLARNQINRTRDTNQIANYALVEWGDNMKAADKPPAEYLPYFTERMSPQQIERMYYWHALPEGWEEMSYEAFLQERRERMAKVVEEAYQVLAGDEQHDEEALSVAELVALDEGNVVEFKSTLRKNLHTGERDSRMEDGCLKTIVGFLNKDGGTLLIGVADDGDPVGIKEDGFANEDKFYLHLTQLINSRVGQAFTMYIHPRFEDYQGVRVMAVECQPSRKEVFLKTNNQDKFYVRTGPSTEELTGERMQEYIRQRFG